MLTPQIQDKLDAGRRKPAVLIPDGDTVYITNGWWLLAITGAQHHLSDEVLKAIRRFTDQHKYVDWLILNAQMVDFEAGKFTPHGARKARDIAIHSYSHPRVESARELVEAYAPSIYGDGFDLGALYRDGEAYPRYEKQEGDSPLRSSSILSYVFRQGEKVVAVSGAFLQAFVEMGFTVTCPKEMYDPSPKRHHGMAPPIGLYLDDVEPPIFGFLMPRNDSGIRLTDDGRKLKHDASVISWIPPEKALEDLQAPANYRPGQKLQLQGAVYGVGTYESIDALRWCGLEDDQIEALYEEGREDAYDAQHQHIVDQSHVEWEHLTERADMFQYEGYRRRAERALSRLRELEVELDVKLDPGRLGDIIHYVNTHTEAG